MRRKTAKKAEAPTTPDPASVQPVWIGAEGERLQVFLTEADAIAWLRDLRTFGYPFITATWGNADLASAQAPRRIFTGQLAVDHELERVQPEAYLRVKP